MSVTAQPYILVVEDEEAIATPDPLQPRGGGIEGREGSAPTAKRPMIRIDEKLPDLVILDWTRMLPSVSGIEICQLACASARCTRNLPIIILTARGEETDRVRGLDFSADDYVVKPFSMSELSARVRAPVLRRIRPGLA